MVWHHCVVEIFMETDENEVFDDSVDPYDRDIDFVYDDGITGLPQDEAEEDDDSWDSAWDDMNPQRNIDSSAEEMADYDEIDD